MPDKDRSVRIAFLEISEALNVVLPNKDEIGVMAALNKLYDQAFTNGKIITLRNQLHGKD